MTDVQTLALALGIPALLGFPVWVARHLMTSVTAQLAEQTRLLTILVDRVGGLVQEPWEATPHPRQRTRTPVEGVRKGPGGG